MKYYVDMGVKVDTQEEWAKVNKVARDVLGLPDSAGTGDGVRDSQWYTETEEQASNKAEFLRQALIGAGFRIVYVDVATEPETPDEMRDEGWSEEDIKDYFDNQQ